MNIFAAGLDYFIKGGPVFLKMVGAARFELTASCTRNKRATKLRYAPTTRIVYRIRRALSTKSFLS